jgi:acetyl-CoA/propionyl-CoA carboxylase biotin carboxyl carrier protein
MAEQRGPVFQRVLIANRGEIAIRVMRTCRELGIETVAVYSDLDQNAQHVRYADMAFALGGKTVAESYLQSDRILEIIQESKSDAVHPGYGFFSENADFARRVTDIGVAWIGPPPEAIEIMGDKISSRKAAVVAEVASVPGTLDPIKDVSEIVSFGQEFGWPVAIKAAYGGGGKGLKICENADEAQEAFESAAREAQAYFGRSEAYLERYLTNPRHIEVQVFADKHGNAVWLGDRDCSTQRRHQKLIEEAPAANLPDSVRTAMGEAATKIALSCGYVNAGTVEMLYEDGEFWFLEMNTRLQVEHCVTEETTGLDLVAEQLRVAAGEPLSFTQDQIVCNGHAIECRINAEDPSTGFLPSPGTITEMTIPAGPGVRWDSGYEEGDAISAYYDNLIGKLIVWAPDRPAAISRMRRALAELKIAGVKTTAPAQELLLSLPAFAEARHTTKWLEKDLAEDAFSAISSTPDSISDSSINFAERLIPIEIDKKRFSVKVWMPVDVSPTGKANPRPRPARSAGSSSSNGTISSPMQGTIVKILVSVGDKVEIGQALLVLEAMKMENQINSESAGVIKELRVEAGATVGAGDVLVVIE